MQELEQQFAGKMSKLHEKHQIAERNSAEATARVIRKLQFQTEKHRLKNEFHRTKMVMASRALENVRRKKTEKQMQTMEANEARKA